MKNVVQSGWVELGEEGSLASSAWGHAGDGSAAHQTPRLTELSLEADMLAITGGTAETYPQGDGFTVDPWGGAEAFGSSADGLAGLPQGGCAAPTDDGVLEARGDSGNGGSLACGILGGVAGGAAGTLASTTGTAASVAILVKETVEEVCMMWLDNVRDPTWTYPAYDGQGVHGPAPEVRDSFNPMGDFVGGGA